MQTVEIPRADWRVKLDEFSVAHQGWRVSLEVLDDDAGAQPEIDDLPLVGVTAEVTADPEIVISAGTKGPDQVTHVIHKPTRVQLERNDEGADLALEIESSDNAKAIMRFISPALIETVDGVPRDL